MEAGGSRHPRGLPRTVRRPRVPATHARHLDDVHRRRGRDPLRPRHPASRRRRRSGHDPAAARRARRSCRRHRRVPQTRALRGDRRPGRAHDRPGRRRTRHRGPGARPTASTRSTGRCRIRRRRSRRRASSPSWARGSAAHLGDRTARPSSDPTTRSPPISATSSTNTVSSRSRWRRRGGSSTCPRRISCGASPAAFGIAPHRYLVGRRIDAARAAAARGGAHRRGGDGRRLPRPGAPHPALQASRRDDAGSLRPRDTVVASWERVACGKLAT